MILPDLDETAKVIVGLGLVGAFAAIWPVCWLLDRIERWRTTRPHRWHPRTAGPRRRTLGPLSQPRRGPAPGSAVPPGRDPGGTAGP